MENLWSNKPLLFSIAVLIVLIIVLIYTLRQKQKYFSRFLDGVWNMDEEFCEDAGLQSGYFAIEGENAYLLLHVEDEEPINEPVKISGISKFNPDLCDDNDIFIRIESESDVIKNIYPEKMHCIVNLLEGVMIWKNNEETLAIFKKINA
jgi:hypothetical protein